MVFLFKLFVTIFFFFLFCFSLSESQITNFKPRKLVLPVRKDSATDLYVTTLHKRTPLTELQLVVDLKGDSLWVSCDENYLSSTYQAPFCHSTQCSRANTHLCGTCSTSKPRPGCNNNTCWLASMNPITRQVAMGELAQDVLSLQSTHGSYTGPMVTVPQFLFLCAPSQLLRQGLPNYVQGVAGLGHAPIALPTQLASHFGLPPRFALCLPSTSKTTGVIFFGEGPSILNPGIDVSQSLTYTPLMINPQGEYHVQVTSIKVNNISVPMNTTSLLTMDKYGFGGTKISTTKPYTILHHSIYEPFVQTFTKQFSNIPRVKPVKPFTVCYDSTKFSRTQFGSPSVPNINIVFHQPNVYWRIMGVNSMKEIKPGVTCLGFIDGGLQAKEAILIGAHQMVDNFVQFELVKSRLGFSSSLLLRKTNCANFNFSTSPNTP